MRSKMDQLRLMRDAQFDDQADTSIPNAPTARFDRAAYQREYMRKVREHERQEREKAVKRTAKGYTIYAVTLREHPGVVKVGMTIDWNLRRKSYDNWNLRDGDAIDNYVVFLITEPYVDLAFVEAACLNALPHKRRYKVEWLYGEIGDVAGVIAMTITNLGLTFMEE